MSQKMGKFDSNKSSFIETMKNEGEEKESGQINTIYYHKRKMNGEWKSNESTMSADV